MDQLDAFVCQQLQLGQVGLEHIANVLDEYIQYTLKINQDKTKVLLQGHITG